MVLTDLAGNVKTLTEHPNSGMDFRGFFYSLTTGGGSPELQLLCCDEVSLNPLENVDVFVENLDVGTVWAGSTGSEGTALINLFGPNTGDRMLLTLVKDGYEITSMMWTYTYHRFTMSMLMRPDTEADGQTTAAMLLQNTTGVDLPQVYMGGSRRITGSGPELLDAGVNPEQAVLTVNRNRLQFAEAFGVITGPPALYQWAWSNPFLTDAAATEQALIFSEDPTSPATDQVQPLLFDSLLGATALRQARLTALLPGILGDLPIGVDVSEDLISGTQYRFDVPLPPSLAVNEVISSSSDSAFDPPYELILEPQLGPASNDTLTPDQALFEKYLRFEVEEREDATDPKVVKKRIGYVEADLGNEVTVTLPAAALEASSATWPDVTFNHVLKAFDSGNHRMGGYVLVLENPDASRRWRVYLASQAAGTDDPVTFSFPDLSSYGALVPPSANDFTDFDAAGDYAFVMEAFHVELLDMANSFLSEVFRKWKTFWRSGKLTVTK